MRSIGPAREAELEDRMWGMVTPVLVLFGTMDQIIPSEMGRHHKALLPHAHLIFVSDASHAPGAERQEAFVVTRRRTMIFP